MRAIICDKCSAMWKDERFVDDTVNIKTVLIGLADHNGNYSNETCRYDLCKKCRSNLFDFLDDKNTQ
jgi:hypothetical protein